MVASPPVAITEKDLKCWRCGQLLAEEVTPPYKFTCRRCRAVTKKDG